MDENLKFAINVLATLLASTPAWLPLIKQYRLRSSQSQGSQEDGSQIFSKQGIRQASFFVIASVAMGCFTLYSIFSSKQELDRGDVIRAVIAGNIITLQLFMLAMIWIVYLLRLLTTFTSRDYKTLTDRVSNLENIHGVNSDTNTEQETNSSADSRLKPSGKNSVV